MGPGQGPAFVLSGSLATSLVFEPCLQYAQRFWLLCYPNKRMLPGEKPAASSIYIELDWG